jgi:hypothetical protein
MHPLLVAAIAICILGCIWFLPEQTGTVFNWFVDIIRNLLLGPLREFVEQS